MLKYSLHYFIAIYFYSSDFNFWLSKKFKTAFKKYTSEDSDYNVLYISYINSNVLLASSNSFFAIFIYTIFKNGSY